MTSHTDNEVVKGLLEPNKMANDFASGLVNGSVNLSINGAINGSINGTVNLSISGVVNGAINGAVNASHEIMENGSSRCSGNPNTVIQQRDVVEPIAIVGMAMRLPGGIHDPQSFWELLVSKRDVRVRVPEDRWNVDAFYNRFRKPETAATDAGYFLNNLDLRDFDAGFFNLSKKELERLDPQQRLLLEVTWECLENAGETNWRGKNIGCWVGVFGEDWLEIQSRDMQDMGLYRITGSGDFVLGNRISYEFDFKGPSMTVKTGCSSSLICLHMACEALNNGDCESAIVGGTNLLMSPTMTIAMSEQGVLSPTGSCKSFDAAADGYARGEAINALYVKKLKDAMRDGDPIRAVIRATATNSDGKTPGISYPNSLSHETVIRRAYEVAGIQDFSETAMVECHGTGTTVGDPLETRAIAKVFGGNGVYIGSVKPNVGHSEGASGLTSTIKMVLALEKKTIPPNMLFKTPNPMIPFAEAKLSVPLEPTPWPSTPVERASVNSFGIGGANAHVVLDSTTSFHLSSFRLPSGNTSRPELLVFSANHAKSLTKVLENYAKYLEANDVPLDALAYTLGARRNHMMHRSFCVTDDRLSLEFAPPGRPESSPPDLSFVFTGQGAQWAGMGKELLTDYPSYHDDIRAMDHELAQCSDPPSWTIEGELLKPPEVSALDQAEYSQPLCTAVQIGVVNLLRSWNINPACVVGHSSGEIAAAYACRAITAKEAILVAYYRGQITKKVTLVGGMAAIGLGRDDVSPFLTPGVIVACENSHESVTLSGDSDKLETVMAAVKKSHPDVLTRLLRVGRAYHSHHMKQVGEEYEKMVQDSLSSLQPSVPFYSSVSGKAIFDAGKLNADYWRSNLESPVLFNSAVLSILNSLSPHSVFIEIGPHGALASPLRQIFKKFGSSPTYITTLKRNTNGTKALLSAVGQIYCQGVEVNFLAMNSSRTVLTDLPTYPWHYQGKYWIESRLSRAYRLREFAHHDILGSLTTVSNDFEPTWRNILKLDNVPWILDHQVRTDIVFPGAGYVAMIGEAIRQLTGLEDYSVRNFSITSAMIFNESQEIETMVTLHLEHLTVSLDSTWYEFSISSYNGTSWTKNCVGQARGGSETELFSTEKPADLPRQIPSEKWYQAMAKVGLNYGPAFNGLMEISASICEHIAMASVFDNVKEEESHYALHPTTLDFCFQLFSVALANGQSRKFSRLCLPTFIEELYVRNTPSKIRLQVHTAYSQTGAIQGKALGTANGEIVLQLKGLKLSPVEGNSVEDADPHAAVQLYWKPDIDFLQDKNLMKVCKSVRPSHILTEKLTALCIIEASSRLATVNTDQPHFEQYLSWIQHQRVRITNNEYPLVEKVKELAALSTISRRQLIEQTYEATQDTDAGAIGKALMRVLDNAQDVIHNRTNALELLLKDNVLTEIYNFAGMWDYKDFLNAVTHDKPHLRILEIGAGTGATTSAILKNISLESGERMYAKYTFTDISAGFFVAAKERFHNYKRIDYAVLDISKDPIEQGFEGHSYDLIVATNVIHATPSIGEALANVRKLLQPRGRLFLQELSPTTKWINFIMGIFPGWWLGYADNRIEQPFISPGRWNDELLKAGFSGAQTVLYDDDYPYQINVNIIARPVTTAPPKNVTLIHLTEEAQILRDVEVALVKNGFRVDFRKFPELPPTGQDVISLMDLEVPFFVGISAENLEEFLKYMVFLQNQNLGMLWVTRASQIHCKDPSYSPILGMSRTIRSELGLAFATLELDEVSSDAWDPLCNVFAKFQRRSKEEEVDSDSEFALVDGVVYIGRFHWFVLSKELSQEAISSVPKSLEIEKRGLLQTLHWRQRSEIILAADEVEIETRAVGMNFKDVLIAMGIVEGQEMDSSGLGCECAGVIRAVGSDVEDLKVGDRVMVVTAATLSTRLATKAKLCAKIPENLTFEDAATMPCVYVTVIHSLIDLGRLEKNQTVLIHSASGGVGIAAIQICQWVGATIFVTVSNEEKAQYLMNAFGISRDRIFNSRDTSFLPNIMLATNGRGVDVALNSLSGELLHATWKCVAEFGKMLEIGKRDFIGRGKLSMDLFEANRSFFGIDLSRVANERPDNAQRLLQKILELYNLGAIKPIRPVKTFVAEQIEEAFRYLQKGTHMGKVVISMPVDSQTLPAGSTMQKLLFKASAAYLMIGGLGGLGQAVSTWMVEHGAKHLVYLSRTAGRTERDRSFLKELETQGCSAQTFPGSVSVLSDVEYAVKNSSKPIAGVMQMSMVLRDRAFAQMSIDAWETVVSPKIEGTWNLHRALMLEKLDFFILFSSFSGLVGQWGQANYAAANTFLDAFTQYRHENGLPASVLDIGVVTDVGYVSENKAILESFTASAVHGIREQDMLDSLHLMIARSAPPAASVSGTFTNPGQVGIGLRSTQPIAQPSNRNIWKRDPRMSLYRNLEEVREVAVTSTDEALKSFLSSAKNNPDLLDLEASLGFLAREIGLRLFSFLLRPEEELDIKLSLVTAGLDSLVAIEMRNWWKQSLGLDVTVLELLAAGSIEELGTLAARRLKAKFEPDIDAGLSGEEGTRAYLAMKAP